MAKYRTTYVEGLLQHCRAGRVFTTWDQLAAATGRLTSVSPNLQGRTVSFFLSWTPVIPAGIPKGEIEAGGRTVNMRSALISSDGFTFLCADFEQIEVFPLLRMLCNTLLSSCGSMQPCSWIQHSWQPPGREGTSSVAWRLPGWTSSSPPSLRKTGSGPSA